MRNKAINKEVQDRLTPDGVLKDLLEGNNRYINEHFIPSNISSLIKDAVDGQHPKAVFLSCVDSRVLVEQIFDQTIGDVFVARVAGNFENVDILGSMEYACKVAGSKLVFVLGHQSCGAVKAACDGVQLGNITAMLSKIMPAVQKSSTEIAGEKDSNNADFVAKTVENNVLLTMDRIRKESSILADLESIGEIKIVGGVYSLETGKVTML